MISQEDELYLIATDMQPVHQFLTNALTLKIKGNQNHYHHIVSTLVSKQDGEMLWKLYLSLSCNISLLTKSPDSYRELIQSIYSYDWKCETKVSVALLHLLGSMVSSNVTFLIPTFQFIISSFLPPLNPYLIQRKNQSNKNGQIPFDTEMIEYHQKRLHKAMTYLLTTVPTGRSELYPVLYQHFPHKSFDLVLLQSYATQVLKITDYFPGIQENILDLLFQKSLDLDVSTYINIPLYIFEANYIT
jgi:RNA polymerase I-specific transcription initiation factor RRN3